MTESMQIKKTFENYPKVELDNPSELLGKLQGFFPILKEFLESVNNNPYEKGETFIEIEKKLDMDLPIHPQSWEYIVNYLKMEFISRFNSNANNKFMAYIPGHPAPASIVGAMITPVFNQFVGSVIASPGGVALESISLNWIKELMGYSENSGACYTSGGSMANLTCLYSALNEKIPWFKEEGLFRNKIPLVYCSDQTHNSIIKALLMFGLGKKNIRIIKSTKHFQLDIGILRKTIEDDKKINTHIPVILIANAGTTNTGAIDDLDALFEISKEFNLWFHIDGSYGALSRVTETKASRLLKNINKADSIALDAHKWLFIPFEAGIALVKDRKYLKRAFSIDSDYLMDSHLEEDQNLLINYWEYSFQLTRELRGLKVWMFFLSYGVDGLKTFITRNIMVAKYLEAKVQEDDDLELMSSSELSIVCFRWMGDDDFNDKIITIIQKSKDYYVSRTLLKNKSTIRVCIVNLTSEPALIDGLLYNIHKIAESVYV